MVAADGPAEVVALIVAPVPVLCAAGFYPVRARPASNILVV
jgi:hypothetical protein